MGKTKLSKKWRELRIELAGHKCEECEKLEDEIVRLEIHKINPNLGYVAWNTKVVCKYKGKIENRYCCHSYFSSAQNKARGIS